MRTRTSVAVVSVAILVGAAPAAAQGDFQWHGPLTDAEHSHGM